MNKSFGFLLVLAIAFQATTAVPLEFSVSISVPIEDYYNSIVASLNSAAAALVGGITNVVNSLSTTSAKLATSLSAIPQTGLQLAFNLLNSTSAATTNSLAALQTQLNNLSANVSPALQNLITAIRNAAANLPNEINISIGTPIVNLINDISTKVPASVPQATIDNITATVSNLLGVINTGLTNLPNAAAADLTKLSADIQTAVTNAMAPLIELTKSADQATSDFANLILADIQKVVAGTQTSLEKFVSAALNASTNVAQKIQTGIQNLVNDAVTAAYNAWNAATNAAAGFIDQKIQFAANVYNETQKVLKSVSTSLNSVGLQARSLLTTLTNKANDALAYANSTRVELRNVADGFLTTLQSRTAALNTQLNGIFANVTAQIQVAVNASLSPACAIDALANVETIFANSQVAAQACSQIATQKVQDNLDLTLNQVTNALDGVQNLSGAASKCIKDWQAGTTSTLAATSCLTSVSASAVLNTISTGFSTLIANLRTEVANILNNADSCAATNIANVQIQADAALKAFKTCAGA